MVNLMIPWTPVLNTSLFARAVVKAYMLAPPVPTTNSRMPAALSRTPADVCGAKRW